MCTEGKLPACARVLLNARQFVWEEDLKDP